MERLIYTDLEAVIMLYRMGDLPKDQMAFPYKDGSGSTTWIHVDEIKKQLALRDSYPQASNLKSSKK